MGRKLIFSGSAVMFLLLFLSITLFSQANLKKSEYHPEPGQEGKDVRWFPTPRLLVDKMLDMAGITPSDLLIDLGSGDGRTVITAAQRGLHAIGIVYNPDMVRLSRENAIKEGVADRTEFIETDLFMYDFSRATVVTMFLLPEINLRLRPKLLAMKPGTRIVSTTFKMQNWQYDDMVQIEDNKSRWTSAYLWIVPAKAAGTWRFDGGELVMEQAFQMVSGKLNIDGRINEISGGRIRGYDISFMADGVIYHCKLNGNIMMGTKTKDGKETAWEAERLP